MQSDHFTKYAAWLIFLVGTTVQAQLAPIPVLPAGAELDLSIRNEVEHVRHQAINWMRRHQNEDGSWGISNKLMVTALAVSALATDGVNLSDECARAVVWLNNSITNENVTLKEHAWRFLSLALTLKKDQQSGDFLKRLALQVPARGDTTLTEEWLLWQEALAMAHLATAAALPEASTNQLHEIAQEWPAAITNSYEAWRIAHLINQAGSGRLARHNQNIEWRTFLARRFINTQRRSAEGGGYWGEGTIEQRVFETASALLCLREL